MHNITINDIKKIFKKYIMIAIPIFIIFIWENNHFLDIEIKKTKELIIQEQRQNSETLKYIIDNTFDKLYENVFLVKNSKEIDDYINKPTDENYKEAEQVIVRIASSKKSFDQIRYIDNNGNEIIRVNNTKEGQYIVPKNELQNKKNRSYYIKTSVLDEGEVFLSDIDLNIENGEIEIPYKPVVRIATPIYSNNNEYKGIIIINYLGNDLLKIFEEQFKEENYTFVKHFLINKDGYYVYNEDKDKSFGFMFTNKIGTTIALENPTLWHIIKSKDYGIYEKDNHLDFFIKISPLEKMNIEDNNKYSWIIVSNINLNELPIIKNDIIFGLRDRDLMILIGLSILLFILVTIHYYYKGDKEQLNITNRIAENTNDAVIITDNNTNIIYVNKTFEKITGYKSKEVVGFKMGYFKSNKQTKEFYKNMWKEIDKNDYWQGELWDVKKDGLLYPKKLTILALRGYSNKKVEKYIGIFTDLTRIKEVEKYANKSKNYNLETNLPNENLLINLIENSISGQDKFFVIYFSIENYNNIKLKFENNNYINDLIDNIKGILKKEDFIAQITNNNFVIGLGTYKTKEEVEVFLNNLFYFDSKLFCINNEELFFDIKAGISIYPENGKISNELIFNAYIALESVLKEKEKKYMYYKKELRDTIEKEIEMKSLLRKAIINDELEVYYQPQIEIEGEKIVGAEALLRWKSSKLGNISPAVFIPLAEKTGQIVEIGYWLIERIFKDYLLIKDIFNQDFRISINISPVQFKDKELIPKFKELAKKYNIDFKNFEIEITEGILLTDIKEVNEKLNEFKEMGITIAIDDFGTGFSSLSYLKDLNVDKLKIDRSFIKDYPESDDGEMAQIITNMANKLKLKVITEGAENKEQIDYLKSIGCNLIQGYYYSRPLPKDEFMKKYNIEN